MTTEKKNDEVRALDRPAAKSESLVPASYAEKAMSSLLRLHEDLVEEKERRIDLYRRLMEREQSLAEVRAYVKLLESELARRGFDPTVYAIDPASGPAAAQESRYAVAHAAGVAAAATANAPAASNPQPPAVAAPPIAPAPRPAPAAQQQRASGPAESGDAPVIAWAPRV